MSCLPYPSLFSEDLVVFVRKRLRPLNSSTNRARYCEVGAQGTTLEKRKEVNASTLDLVTMWTRTPGEGRAWVRAVGVGYQASWIEERRSVVGCNRRVCKQTTASGCSGVQRYLPGEMVLSSGGRANLDEE